MFFLLAQQNDQNGVICYDSIDLAEFLGHLETRFNVQIFLSIKEPILLKNISFNGANLITILNFLCQSLDLTFVQEGSSIFLHKNKPYCVSYSLKFFFEDNLPNLSSFFDEKNTSTNVQVSTFWQEVEKNIKQISSDNFSIDKYNGIVNVIGTDKTHQEILAYLSKINKSLYQQVLVECKVLEISTEISQSMDLCPILNAIQENFALTSLGACVESFITECRKIYHNAQIKTSTDIHILLMSQHTGRILSSKIDFFQEQEVMPMSNSRRNHGFVNNLNQPQWKDVVGTYYQRNEHGFSLTVVPLILEDHTILLKLRPSISTLQKEGEASNKDPQNIQRREFNTVIKTISAKNHILGGLYIEYEAEEKSEVTSLPILSSFFNKVRKIKRKSYFVLFIKVTIC